MRICFLVPDGVGLRNYLFSKLIKSFKEGDEIILWTTLPLDVIKDVEDLHSFKVTHYKMATYKEGFKDKLLKEVITYARLKYNSGITGNPTIMLNWTRKKYKGTKWFFYKLAALLGFFMSWNYKWIENGEKKYSKLLANTSYADIQKKQLEDIKPDVIFCTHQRSLDAAVINEVAMDIGIKTIGAIYSWDNLPKARLLVRSEYYIVWSEYMKSEFEQFYPEINKKNIVITGTPQFEFYFNNDFIEDREVFFNTWGLDPNKKVICFSGNDLTFPCDEKYLKDLAEGIMLLPENKRPQILLRRCPVDMSGRFDKVVEEFQDLIKVSDPKWKNYNNSWVSIAPTMEDVKLLVNVVWHCDAVINVGSTMAHDFAVYNKPAVYINYDQPDVKGWSAIINNKYQHFRSMPDNNCVVWLNSKKDIPNLVSKVLSEPDRIAESRGKWLETIAKHPLNKASFNIKDVLN